MHSCIILAPMHHSVKVKGDCTPIDPDSDEAFLEIFDLQEYEWLQQETTGDFPRMGQGSFFAVIGKTLYVFGGMNDEDYFDGIYMLDLEAFHWQQLPDIMTKPSPKSFGGMVAYFDSLVMVGGVGKTPFQPSEKGSTIAIFTCRE